MSEANRALCQPFGQTETIANIKRHQGDIDRAGDKLNGLYNIEIGSVLAA